MMTMTKPETNAPAELIKQWRKASGMSQEQLAAHLPIKVDQLRKIEQGQSLPSMEAARALDLALGSGGAIWRAVFSQPDDDLVAQLQTRVDALEKRVEDLVVETHHRLKAVEAGRTHRRDRRQGDT